MKVIQRDFFGVSRKDTFHIIPIGDVHIGAAACDEARLKEVVREIRDTPNTYWIGMGDYCDFITMKDPRFSVASLADWMTIADTADIAKAERDRFLKIISPIADKCLTLLEGNHEQSILRHYERNIYSEIVSAVKEYGKFKPDENLAMGYNGWLRLNFYRGKKKERVGKSSITMFLHHGFVGGKLAGAKALNMQRVLWAYDCDIALMGHSHNTGVQVESVYRLDRTGRVRVTPRYGAYSGTFLRSYSSKTSTYSEVKGYFPLPLAGVEIILRPGAETASDRIRIVTIA